MKRMRQLAKRHGSGEGGGGGEAGAACETGEKLCRPARCSDIWYARASEPSTFHDEVFCARGEKQAEHCCCQRPCRLRSQGDSQARAGSSRARGCRSWNRQQGVGRLPGFRLCGGACLEREEG